MKGIKKILYLLMFPSVLFMGNEFSQRKSGKEEDFYKVLDQINKSRLEDDKREVKFNDNYINWIKDEDKELNEKDFDVMIESFLYARNPEKIKYNPLNIITIDEAKEDIDTLFNLLRYTYGAYGYFGGDEVFYKAKQNIINSLKDKINISVGELSDILWEKLSFCSNDGHFYISKNLNNHNSDKNYKVMKIYYFYDKFDFFKDEKGYYKINGNESYYIESIDGNEDVDKFMKLTINDEGKLVYAIAKIDKMSFDVNLPYELVTNVKYVYGYNKVLEEQITLTELNRYAPSDKKSEKGYEFYVDKGIPTFSLKRLWKESKEDASHDEFAKSASKFKEYPVNILDIRETMGGSWLCVYNWVQNYIGHELANKDIYMNVNSKVIKKAMKIYGCNTENSIDDLFHIDKSEEVIRGKNDNLIFMLIHKRNASSSDLIIRNLKQLDNVILVGSNSAGIALALDILHYKLKNSNIDVALGQGLSITAEGDGFELKGYEPDILVDSDKAEEKVKKLINHYKLLKV